MGENPKEINVVIVGAGKGGTTILKILLELDMVHVLSIADINSKAEGMELARRNNIPTTQDFTAIVTDERLDVIIEATGEPLVQAKIRELKNHHATIMEAQSAHLMMKVVNRQQELLRIKELQEQLAMILDTAQEGFQVVDKEGRILYVNKSFSDITKINADDRIGKNIYKVSPNGSLAEVLKTGRPVIGNLNIVASTNIEVLSNASPMIMNGEIVGAVGVFRDISDFKRMTAKLEESKEVIDFLKDEISGLVSAKYTFDDLIGVSPSFLACIRLAKQAARTDSTVLLTGESGTGKELFAHAIHNYSDRRQGPFVKVNCAAIPDNLLESELFGYEKGAFTGAHKAKMGKFELANGGTIFLDEIGDMSVNLQAKLLRVLQEREIERLGGNTIQKVDVRIIAATNHKLEKHVNEGSFRQDLFYRLNVINVELPPLRERTEDISELVQYILKKLNRRHRKYCTLELSAMELIKSYTWPGNIREMENLLERAIIMSEGDSISLELLQSFIKPTGAVEEDAIISLAELEKQMIYKALDKYGYTIVGKKQAAQNLEISLATLYNKLKEYEKRNSF